MIRLRSIEPPMKRVGASPRQGPLGLIVLLGFLTLAVAGAAALAAEGPAASPAPTPAPRPTPAPTPAPEAARKPRRPAAVINKDSVKGGVDTSKTQPSGTGTPAPSAHDRAPLRFDDNDLTTRYHGRPAPAEPSEESDRAVKEVSGGAALPAGPVTGSASPAPATPPSASPPPAKPAPGKPAPSRPALPQADPLKVYHDREANEKFRKEQIEALRARIAQAQSRLDYLNQRRLAVLDPLRIPPKAPEGEQIDPKLKPKDLLDQLDAEIATASSELDDLKTQLVTIETHFQRESGNK